MGMKYQYQKICPLGIQIKIHEVDLLWKWIFRSMKKITVIGGSGFVGTGLCKHLSNNKTDFEIIDLKMSKQFPDHCKVVDICDLHGLRDAITGGIVIHLAAAHRDDLQKKSGYYHTNVVGTKNIIDVCVEKKIKKIIFTSSVAVYGFSKVCVDETAEIKPFNEYGRTKFIAEEELRSWQKNSDNSLIILRPTVIFGEGNRGNVFNLLNQISSGKFIMVGTGQNKKSMAYIGNVTAFLLHCISIEQKYGLYNYADNPDLSMNDLVALVRFRIRGKNTVGLRVPYWLGLPIGYLADLVAVLTGRNLPVSSIRIKKFVSNTQFRSEKMSAIKFNPPFKLTEGLEHTLECEFISPKQDRVIFYTE